MQRIRQGDDVIVLAGKDKGRRGKVDRVVGERVFVDGINMIKKHVKGNPQAGDPGGIQEREASVHVSNVALFNPDTKKGRTHRLPRQRRWPEGTFLPRRQQRGGRLRSWPDSKSSTGIASSRR